MGSAFPKPCCCGLRRRCSFRFRSKNIFFPVAKISRKNVQKSESITQRTQNLKDLLASAEIENIFENSDFILMLNQAPGDREILAKKLGISARQLSYVKQSGAGEGLLLYGDTILPFVDRFPQNTELYRLMTTRPNETAGQEEENG